MHPLYKKKIIFRIHCVNVSVRRQRKKQSLLLPTLCTPHFLRVYPVTAVTWSKYAHFHQSSNFPVINAGCKADDISHCLFLSLAALPSEKRKKLLWNSDLSKTKGKKLDPTHEQCILGYSKKIVSNTQALAYYDKTCSTPSGSNLNTTINKSNLQNISLFLNCENL